MDALRVLAFFLSAMLFTFFGCARDSTPPKADVPVAKNEVANNEVASKEAAKKEVAKKEDPDSKVKSDLTDNPQAPQALVELLRKVTDISPEDVTRYETFLDDPTTINLIAYQGALPYTADEVRDVINLGLEKLAVSALIKLIQQKKSSTDKADLLICAQSIKALGQFGPSAREATAQLAELQNHKDIAVGSAAKLALADIGKTK